MNKQKMIIAALAFAATVGVPSAVATGTPLLSGYGGPGTGPQQILGAGLVNGGGGHGGGSGTGSGAGQAGLDAGGRNAGAGSRAGSPNAGAGQTASTGVAGNSSSSRAGGDGRSSARRTGDSPRGSSADETAASRFTTLPASTLGLSGSQMTMILVLVAGLALTTILTRWLAGLQDRRRPADKKTMSLGSGQ